MDQGYVFGTIFTTAKLEPDDIIEKRLCNHCMRCVRMCPSNALVEKDYPEGITDKKACATFSDELNKRDISPCGICIKVCPIGEDRKPYGKEDASIYEKERRIQEVS